LLEILNKRAGDAVKCAVRLTFAHKVDMYNPVGEGDFVVARKAIEYNRQSLRAFSLIRTFEILVKHGGKQVFIGSSLACDTDFIGKLSIDEAVIICEVDCGIYN
jgi:hypothetical protein